ncbi:PspC domain-containing protein [Sinomonas halotolerans]|uniref:PspC domain-containing protein n=1 Tax=Sinomonas halotolerans TaxID=1644133 RepID=A0ABU9WZZ2_9MICC
MSTEPVPGGGARPGPSPLGPVPAGSEFFSWVRGLGIVRGRDRWAGGVASGLAHRWGASPVLVRVLFVLAGALGGIGLLAYGVLWMILPEPDGRIHVESALHGRWTAGMTGALVAAVLGLGGTPTTVWFGDQGWAGPLWAVVWVSALVLVVYAIAVSRRSPVAAGATPPGAPSHPGTADTAAASAGHPSSPAPLLAPAAPARRGPSGPYTAVVVGGAIVAVALLLSFERAGSIWAGAGPATLWAAAAAVVGIGIVVAGLRGRTAGVLSLFAVVALASGALTQQVSRWGPPQGPTTSSPASVQEAAQGYRLTGASAELDFRALDDAGPLSAEATIPVETAMSSVRITVPEGVPVRVTVEGAMSSVDFGGRTASGLALGDSQAYNAGSPGQTLVIALDAAMSSIEIEQER